MKMLLFLCCSARHKVMLLLCEDTNNKGKQRAERGKRETKWCQRMREKLGGKEKVVDREGSLSKSHQVFWGYGVAWWALALALTHWCHCRTPM